MTTDSNPLGREKSTITRADPSARRKSVSATSRAPIERAGIATAIMRKTAAPATTAITAVNVGE